MSNDPNQAFVPPTPTIVDVVPYPVAPSAPPDSGSYGMAFSGGGFRATAYHLGVLRRLDQLGTLSKIRFISAVSGGAILAAYWCYWLTFEDKGNREATWNSFEQKVTSLLRADVRRWLLIRGLCAPMAYMGLLVALVFGSTSPLGPCLLILTALLIATYLSSYIWWWLNARRRGLVEPVRSVGKDFLTAGVIPMLSAAVCLVSHWLHPFLWDVPVGPLGATWSLYEPPLLFGLGVGLIPLFHTLYVAHSPSKSPNSPKLVVSILRRHSPGGLDVTTVYVLIFCLDMAVGYVLVWPTFWMPWAGLGALIVAYAYLLWHYQAPTLLAWYLDHVFDGKRMADLRPLHGGQKLFLIINATSLNSGRPLYFPSDVSVRPMVSATGDWMPSETKVATAVVASAAFPGLIPPLLFYGGFQGIMPIQAVDGGCYDNQGVEALLDVGCERVIVSDGGASLSDSVLASTWLIGVLLRVRQILSERIRFLNHALLTRILQNNLVYIELRPTLASQGPAIESILPKEIADPVATIRTDLDRFSDVEMFALFSHGYSLIDACLRRRDHEWITRDVPFDCTMNSVPVINWTELGEEKRNYYARYLAASDFRNRLLRWFIRLASRAQ
jgi:predicted acylesterase/phospholipase RssA